MKITIDGTAKEIADLVREIQDRQISGKDIADAIAEKLNHRTERGPIFQ